MISRRKLTKVWLFSSTFGKEPTENYISLYKPETKDARIYIENLSYQRLYKEIRFPINDPYTRYTFEDILNCPYLAFQNEGERKYYAFVEDCSYVNDGTVAIKFKIDPFTTYFDDTIEGKMLVDRLTGAKSLPDPELNFSANQVLKKVGYKIGDLDDEGYHYAKDVILIYVRNTSEAVDDIDSISNDDFWEPTENIDRSFIDDLKFVKNENRKVTYPDDSKTKKYEGPFVQQNDVLKESDNLINNSKLSVEQNSIQAGLLGNYHGVRGPYTGYDIYAIPEIANVNGILHGSIMDFLGANGSNVIGAEYRHIVHPFPWKDYTDIYKLSMSDREKMSQPFTVDLEDFNFPNNIPESLKQAPYYKRLFVSNDGATVIDYNPSASPNDVDGNSSLLKQITITESPEMGSPIVYEFDSSESNGGHQFWVDNTDRSIPFFVDAAFSEIAKNEVWFKTQVRKDFETIRLNVNKHITQSRLNARYTDSVFNNQDYPRLHHTQEASINNLSDTLETSRLNLVDSQSTNKDNLNNEYKATRSNQKRSNTNSHDNLARTQGVEKGNLSRSQLVAINNLSRSNDVKAKNLNRTLSASKTALDNNNRTSEDTIKTNKQIAYNNNKKNNNEALKFRSIGEKYEGYSAYRRASSIEKKFLLDQHLSSYTLRHNNKAALETITASLGLGAIGAGVGGIAKGFDAFVPSIIAGAVSATAATAALDIKQQNSLKLWGQEWYANPVYGKSGNPQIPWFSRGPYRDNGNKYSPGGIDSMVTDSPLFDPTWPGQVPALDSDYRPGVRQVKANLDEGLITSEFFDKYGSVYDDAHIKVEGSEKEKIDASNRYAIENIKDNNNANIDLNKLKISRSVKNFNANREASTTNLTKSNNNETFNLNQTQGADTKNLNQNISANMTNLNKSNDTTLTNLDKTYNTRINNNNNTLKTAMGNLLRDIDRQKTNQKRSLEADVNSLVVSLIESVLSIQESLASAIIDDFYEYYIASEIKYGKYSDFYNRILNAANNSSITASTGTFWGKVAAGLNKFSIYDVGINARELRYCINYINRYGSYCGLTRFSINLKPNTYVRTKDAHLASVNIPLWATNEVSEKLNQGIYIRET